MIKINVEVQNRSWQKKIKNPKKYFKLKLKKIANLVNFFKQKNISFTILLTNSNNIKKLNKKFRNKNKSTDVLSFPFFTKNNLKLQRSKNIYIGDIAISYQEISEKSKKNFLVEFDKAWIHGLLHLIGHNHIKDKDYYKMYSVEKRILASII
jgi:probable rRNA maturation factor